MTLLVEQTYGVRRVIEQAAEEAVVRAGR